MTKKKNSMLQWIDDRLPIVTFFRKELKDYPTPINLNFLWNFGSLAGATLIIMIISGIFLAIHYIPHTDYAFDSIERIMRHVNYGWLIRYIHTNGASMFFIVIYIHMLRGLYYGSYKSPRELLWILGVVIYLLLILTAFLGYTLPWGQMSYWGATVITEFLSTIPLFGEEIKIWVWGSETLGNPVLNRFFIFHFLLPFIIIGVVALHLVALHKKGSNNPIGIELTQKEKIPFHPYYTIKDYLGLIIFALIWAFFVFFAPEFFSEPENYIPANALKTPVEIVPEWYFLHFYAILRSVPSKGLGVLLLLNAVLVLFIIPWLDTSKVKSAKFRPMYRYFFWLFVISCILLAWSGAQHPEGISLLIGRVCTVFYFSFFYLIMPILGWVEKTIPVPKNLQEYEK